jgi:ribosomal protein L16 Arg81 hydroxylase
VATSLLDGMALVDVLDVLTQHGIPKRESVPFCARLYDDPAFEAGQLLAARLQKIESVLTMQEKMRRLAPVTLGIDRRSGLSGEEFLEEYYSRNRPVLMSDVCDRWPAQSKWSFGYLADTLGRADVEVMADRDSDPRYEVNSDRHRRMMPFNEYVAKMETTGSSNDLYLVANNKLLASPVAQALWDDFELDPRFLGPDPTHTQSFLWLGPAGTITPLHHDTINVLFNQIRGRKRVLIIPALSTHRVYNRVAVYSEVDPVAPDLEKYPLFGDAPQVTIEVGPGDTLFIPAGWWHHVVALESSISVSFTNFLYDNSIAWNHPELPF